MDLISRLFAELRGGDEPLAESAAERIAAEGDRVLPELIRMMDDERVEERWWAVRIAAAMDHPQALTLIRKGLGDSSEDVRQCAALAVRQQPHPEAISELSLLLDSGDPLTRRLEAALPALLDVLENGITRARVEAARALAKIGDKRAISSLYRLLDEESALLTYWAEEGLDAMGVGMIFFKPGSKG